MLSVWGFLVRAIWLSTLVHIPLIIFISYAYNPCSHVVFHATDILRDANRSLTVFLVYVSLTVSGGLFIVVSDLRWCP